MAHVINSARYVESFQTDRTDWGAAVSAGVLAGVVFMIAEMVMVNLFMGTSPWAPPRMIAAMLLGRDVLPPPATFDTSIVMTGMLIHFALSVVLGLLFGWLVHRLAGTWTMLAGALFGLVVYVLDFYVIAPMAFPWFVEAQNWVTLTAHLIFGLVLGFSYAAIRKHRPKGQD